MHCSHERQIGDENSPNPCKKSVMANCCNPHQVLIGSGMNLKGVVDVIERRGYIFEGNHGERRVEIDVPEGIKGKVEVSLNDEGREWDVLRID